jgi:hypothetical protein
MQESNRSLSLIAQWPNQLIPREQLHCRKMDIHSSPNHSTLAVSLSIKPNPQKYPNEHPPTTRASEMHLSTVHSSRYYSAQPESGDAIQPAIQALLRREESVNHHPDWTKIIIIAVVGLVAAGLICLVTGIVWRRIKRRNASKGKQQEQWYGQ